MSRNFVDPPAIVRKADSLEALAAEINAEHEAGEQATRRGLEHFRAAGDALLKAKARCGHGKWLPWLKANVKFSQQTASNYMRLAKLPVTSDLPDQWRVILGNDDGVKPPPVPAVAPEIEPAPVLTPAAHGQPTGKPDPYDRRFLDRLQAAHEASRRAGAESVEHARHAGT